MGCGSGWTRDFSRTKSTPLLLFTNTQQSFKCSSFIKRRREEKGGKLKTKIRRIKQTNNSPCQNIEKQNKQEKQTQLYRSETTELTRVTHGLWYVHRLQRWRRGGGRSHFCVSACSRCSATHTQVGEHTRAHAPHADPHPHAHTLARSMAHPHTDMPTDNGRRAVGYHQSASSSM